jgi:hypothetical protein
LAIASDATATIDATITAPEIRVLNEFFMPQVSLSGAAAHRKTQQSVEK